MCKYEAGFFVDPNIAGCALAYLLARLPYGEGDFLDTRCLEAGKNELTCARARTLASKITPEQLAELEWKLSLIF